MAHFAQLNADNKVVDVLVVGDADCGGGVFPHSEPIGQAFLASLNLDSVWKQTSFNTRYVYEYEYDDSVPPKLISSTIVGSEHSAGGTPFRGTYAGIGYFFDADADVFVAPPTESVTDETV